MLIIFLYLTVCGLSCEPSYVPDSNCSTCVLVNICEAETPCHNNGVCIPGSQYDKYTCNCTNTGYTGTNCTGMFCSSVWLSCHAPNYIIIMIKIFKYF